MKASPRLGCYGGTQTQHLSIDRSFFNRPDVDQMLSLELFRQASAQRPEKIPADDIFDGLEI
jgi:hypothetical protein